MPRVATIKPPARPTTAMAAPPSRAQRLDGGEGGRVLSAASVAVMPLRGTEPGGMLDWPDDTADIGCGPEGLLP